MCFGSKAPPTPAATAPKITPAANYPDGGADGSSVSDQQRKRAAGAQGIRSTIITGSQGLTNQIANTTKATGGLLK